MMENKSDNKWIASITERENIIETLNSLEFHDGTLFSVSIDFVNRAIDFDYAPPESEEEVRLSFFEVLSFEMEPLLTLGNMEINGADFSQHDGVFHANFLFLTGYSKPSCSLRITFNEVSILKAAKQ